MTIHARIRNNLIEVRQKTKGVDGRGNPIYRLIRKYPDNERGWAALESWAHEVGHKLKIES